MLFPIRSRFVPGPARILFPMALQKGSRGQKATVPTSPGLWLAPDQAALSRKSLNQDRLV